MRRTLTRILAIGAATAGLMVTGSAVASAEQERAELDTTCLEEGLDAALADPIGSIEESAHDPVGTIEAEIACVEDVLGL